MATQYYNLPEIDGGSTIDLVNATNGLATATDSALRGVESGIPDIAPLVQGIANAQQTADSAIATAGAAQQSASSAAGVANDAKTAADAAGANAASAALAASAADQKAVAAGQAAANADTAIKAVIKKLHITENYVYTSTNSSQLRVVDVGGTIQSGHTFEWLTLNVSVSEDGSIFKAYGMVGIKGLTLGTTYYVETPVLLPPSDGYSIMSAGFTRTMNVSGFTQGIISSTPPTIVVTPDGRIRFYVAGGGAGNAGYCTYYTPSLYFHGDFGDIIIDALHEAASIPFTETEEFKAAVQAAVLETFSSPDVQERMTQITQTPSVSM